MFTLTCNCGESIQIPTTVKGKWKETANLLETTISVIGLDSRGESWAEIECSKCGNLAVTKSIGEV